MDKDESLKEWAAHQPLSILRLDAVDRAILKIAGKTSINTSVQKIIHNSSKNYNIFLQELMVS